MWFFVLDSTRLKIIIRVSQIVRRGMLLLYDTSIVAITILVMYYAITIQVSYCTIIKHLLYEVVVAAVGCDDGAAAETPLPVPLAPRGLVGTARMLCRCRSKMFTAASILRTHS